MSGDGAGEVRELDPTTVERIAAGEVVERPASAVKELVENSLDADAGRVDVTVEDGGRSLVRVADDGVGMTGADLRRAVQKHTTSKIRDADDLDAGVATLGFRGEALYAIGAVSRTTITTKPRDADAVGGTELRVEGGEVTRVGPAGRPAGTTVEVRELFYNVPARRGYLKTDATEFGHVSRVVTRYALANPDVAVSLTHDGTETFATTGDGDLRAALLSVYGREVAESMVPVEAESSHLDGTPVEAVRGYVSHPETTRSSREYLSTYVNGRYVGEPALREAVLSAYGRQLAADRFPFAVVFVDLPPAEVDANVHPRKLEVRFADEAGVRGAVESAVEDALLSAGLVRSSAPRGRSAPAEAEPDPGGDGPGLDAGTRDPGDGPAGGEASRGRDATGDDEPVRPDRPDRAGASPPGAGDGRAGGAASSGPGRAGGSAGSDPGGDVAGRAGNPDPAGEDGVAPDADRTPAGVARSAGRGEGGEPAPDADRRFRPATENARLPGTGADDARATREFDRLPSMRVLGQVGETYVVAATGDGLVVVDQHAADERVNYERLRARLSGAGTASQALVAPAELALTAREAAAFDDALPELRALGFAADLADDGRTAVVEAVPAALGDALHPALLADALAASLSGGDGGEPVASAADALVADLACHPSVTGNTSLSEGSVVELLSALDDCENPYACPHGRPTVVRVSEDELADRFERDYPGHATRRPED